MDTMTICNMALGLVGGNQILSFSDDSLEAEQCELYYAPSVAFCLEQREWTFAAETRALALEASPAGVDFDYSYKLPSDCLALREVSSDADMEDKVEYQVYENSVVTDSGTLYIRYTKNITDTTLFSPTFQVAVAHKLAEYLSSILTGDKALKQILNQESEDLIEGGGAIDGMQGTPRRTTASRLINARFRGGSYKYGLGKYI